MKSTVKIALLIGLIAPVITAVYCLGRRLPLSYLQLFTTLSVIPVVVAIATPSLLRYDVSQVGSQNVWRMYEKTWKKRRETRAARR